MREQMPRPEHFRLALSKSMCTPVSRVRLRHGIPNWQKSVSTVLNAAWLTVADIGGAIQMRDVLGFSMTAGIQKR